jgi:hypothetical protein
MELRVAVIRILGMDLGHPKNNGFLKKPKSKSGSAPKPACFDHVVVFGVSVCSPT